MRDLNVLETIIARNGLMGKQSTVKHELYRIRSWHQKHGFRGGIVLRELNIPLFNPNSELKVIVGLSIFVIKSL
mgnify:CR=1 FL=1